MKTNQLFNVCMIVLGLVATSASSQTTWRVNNLSNYNGTTSFGENYGGSVTYPVFKEINQAVNYAAVVAGDTLHVEGSPAIYADATITKQLIIIGPGYMLTENPDVSNNTLQANIPRMDFDSGSAQSQVIGMTVTSDGANSDGTIYVNVNGVTIKRCRILRDIQFATNLNDVYILQNFFTNSEDTNALRYNGASSFIEPQEIIFNNNICQKTLIWNWDTGITQCNNNVFDGPANQLNLSFNTDSFQNNILKAAGITANINGGTNNNVQYNTVSLATVFSGTTGNEVANMSQLFVTEGSTDGQYQLQSGSAYNIPGSDGADRGAFGGVIEANRYNLSGLGAIPVVYDVATPGVVESGDELPVVIQARTNY